METIPCNQYTIVAACSHIGMIRKNQEDFLGYSINLLERNWCFLENSEIQYKGGPLVFVVADGMGGLDKGEVASKKAVEITRDFCFKNAYEICNLNNINELANTLFLNVNDSILEYAYKEFKVAEMGTTLLVVFIKDNTCYVFWIGDSRCYHYSDSRLMLKSKDHSYVQDLVDSGKITYEQSFYHPENHIITKFMGDNTQTPVPSFISFEIKEGDKLMLCTDGLNGMIDDFTLNTVFNKIPGAEELCLHLVNMANNAGGSDNSTVIIISFGNLGSQHVLKTIDYTS